MKYFFLFLLILPIAASIEAWPSSIEFEDEDARTFVIHNNLRQNATYFIDWPETDTLILEPGQFKAVKIIRPKKSSYVIIEEVIAKNQNIVNAVKLPVTVEEKKINLKLILIPCMAVFLIIIIFIFSRLKKKGLYKRKYVR